MKETTLRAVAAVAMAALGAYLKQAVVPLAVLVAVMVLDYLTGMAKAWAAGTLCSRTGLQGIVKKVGYLVIVAVAMVADWVVRYGFEQVEITYELHFFVCLMVAVWLIINECISILENVAALGAPVPPWLLKLIQRLKARTEDTSTGIE